MLIVRVTSSSFFKMAVRIPRSTFLMLKNLYFGFFIFQVMLEGCETFIAFLFMVLTIVAVDTLARSLNFTME